MKQKLLLGLIALFTCLFNVTASNDSDNLFKKYRKGRGEEIVCTQIDMLKELRKAKAGKPSEDVDVDGLEESVKLGFHKAKILLCVCFGNVFSSELIGQELNSESMNEFMKDFELLRNKMLKDNKLSHMVVNKNNCNVDCFLPISDGSTIKEGYMFLKMINGSLNCLIHFQGNIKTQDVIESIKNGTFIGISGFEPTFTIEKE